jgi:hypothetical protein
LKGGKKISDRELTTKANYHIINYEVFLMLRGIHPQEADATLHLKSSRIPMMSTVV